MRQNTVYQLKEKDAIRTEGSAHDCWMELFHTYPDVTLHYCITNDIRVEPKS